MIKIAVMALLAAPVLFVVACVVIAIADSSSVNGPDGEWD